MPLRTLVLGLEVENPDVESVNAAPDAPSLFDYDIVIADVDFVFSPRLKDKIPSDEYVEVNDEAGRRFQKVIRKLLDEAVLLMEKGGILVCLLKPRRGIKWSWYRTMRRETIRVNNYDWIPIPDLNVHIASGYGKRKRLCDDPGPFARYIKMPETYWTAYVDWLGVENRGLALNDAGKLVAVEVPISKGSLVLLPLSEHARAGDILLECASRLSKKVSERPPPPWMEKLKVPNEEADQKSLEVLAGKLSKLQTEYDTALGALEKKTDVKRLLYEKDEPLEDVVRKAFRELGFTLKKKDDKDWVASSDIGEAILEVTGSDGSIDIDKLRQLLNYLIDDYKETGVEKKAVLVGNHFVNDPPDARENPFTEKVVGESQVHSMCLLPTVELYRIICHLREGKVNAEDTRRKIFETVGVFKFAQA